MEQDEILKTIVAPDKTMLLMWDVQNMLVDKVYNKTEFLVHNNEVLSKAREKQIPVSFSKITPLPQQFESPARKYFGAKRLAALKPTPEGFALAIEPKTGEIVIPKNTASIFIGTNFELLMRNAGLTTIVFTGIATEIGVESSARDALNRGFFPVIVTDAVSSYDQEAHHRSLTNMKSMMILLTTQELLDLWK